LEVISETVDIPSFGLLIVFLMPIS